MPAKKGQALNPTGKNGAYKIIGSTQMNPRIRRELTSYDMLVDAPPFYSPRWLDCLPDNDLKAQLQGNYLELRREIGSRQPGRGVSLSQDLLIRRVVYHDRMATRMEYAMEYWTMQLMEAEVTGNVQNSTTCEKLLMQYTHLYTHSTGAMYSAMKQLGLGQVPVRETPGTAMSRTIEFKGAGNGNPGN